MDCNPPNGFPAAPGQASGATSDTQSSHDAVPETMSNHVPGEITQGTPSNRLIIAIDFGTTFSAVSYVGLKAGEALAGYLPLDAHRLNQELSRGLECGFG